MNSENLLIGPHICGIGSDELPPGVPGGTVSRTRQQAPAQAGGTRRKGVGRGGAKGAIPEHVPGPRGVNPKRSIALGKAPGGPHHKQHGTPAGQLGQGKSSYYSMRKPRS